MVRDDLTISVETLSSENSHALLVYGNSLGVSLNPQGVCRESGLI